MKKLLLLLILTSTLAISFASFSDTISHKYSESINYLQSAWVVKWYPDGTFGPDREINRAEIMKIILESSLDESIPLAVNCFPDVNVERFAPYICYAKTHNIVKWYTDGSFQPGKSVSNAEWLKMALESFGFNLEATSNQRRYEWYLNFVHDNNIFSKYAIRPDKSMTRGEMAYLTHKLMLEKNWDVDFDWIPDSKSKGCGLTPPSFAPTSLRVNGLQRNFISVIGNKYNQNTPTKLILAFHGRTNSNAELSNYIKLERAANGNAIIVYPSWLPENSSPRNRKNWWDPSDHLRDFALFDAIVEEFSNKYCIDKDQIYVVWHSLWARFANSLSCARGDVIRAVWSVGGSTTINKCSGPVAAMIMHNPDDNLASFAGGITARNQMLWQNGCGPETEPFTWPEKSNCVKYTNCQTDAPVVRCPHSEDDTRGYYYPHTRPSFAWQMMWDFFESQK